MNRNARRRAINLKRAMPAFLGPVAIGNDLAAQNDEDEPITFQQGGATQAERNLAAEWTGLTEADLVLGDLQRAQHKGLRWHHNNDNAARRLENGSQRVWPEDLTP